MENKKYIEKLGKDRLKKVWYVLIDETENDLVSFYVFPEENQGKDVDWPAFHDLKAVITRSGDKEVILTDFAYVSIFRSYHGPAINLFRRTNWENRGIGTLLIKRIEAWCKDRDFKIIRGFLTPDSDTEKLKYFFSKMGWIVEVPAKTEYQPPDGISRGIGTVYKKFRKSQKPFASKS
jgi:GNAT superfamily N-acetyltransferase